MASTQINTKTSNDKEIIFLKSYDQSFTLDIEEEAMITVTCEDVAEWNKMFETKFSEEKSDKLVRALEILLEREGNQLSKIYQEL